ncbi:MAG: lipopolysaccharide transport periplasmic protein LptA [Oligoflexales bacterium]
MNYLNLIILINCYLAYSPMLADLTDTIDEIETPRRTQPINKKARPQETKRRKPSPQKKMNQNEQSKLPIHYSSQNLRGTREAGLLELKTAVTVTQGSLKVTSDNAKIHFTEQEEMERVEALGHVKIHTIDPESGKKVRAHSDELTYHEQDRIITLSGHAKLWRGDDMLQGQVIQYNLDTGWIKVQKVKGQLHTTEKAK